MGARVKDRGRCGDLFICCTYGQDSLISEMVFYGKISRKKIIREDDYGRVGNIRFFKISFYYFYN